MKNLWSLKNKKALITGGTKGIGKAIMDEFLNLGSDVFIIARNKNIDAIIKEKKFAGYNISGLALDVTSVADRKKLFRHVEKLWGKLDILINNAGFNNRIKTIDYNDETYNKVIDLNMKSVFEMCRLFHPLLKKSGDA